MSKKEMNDWLDAKVEDSDNLLRNKLKESSSKIDEMTLSVPDIVDVGKNDISDAVSFVNLKAKEIDSYIDKMKNRLED